MLRSFARSTVLSVQLVLTGRQYRIGILFQYMVREAFGGVKMRADTVIIGFVRFGQMVRRRYKALGGVEK